MKRRGWERAIAGGSEERLESRGAAAQGEEAEAAALEIQFGTDEAVSPPGAHGPGAGEEVDAAIVVTAAQENEAAAQRGGRLEEEARRPGAAGRCGGDARGIFGAQRRDERGAAPAQGGQMAMAPAMPGHGLPAGVEALDLRLETRLARRCEHGDDAQLQAEPDDAPDGVGVLVRALEKRVIVELGEVRQPVRAPVLADAAEHMIGTEAMRARPGLGECPVEGDDIEHLHRRPALDEQALDEIEAVEFRATGGQRRQIPAARRRRAAHARPGIEQAAAAQDAPDGAQRGHGKLARSARPQKSADGRRAALAERRNGQRAPRRTHRALDTGTCAAAVRRAAARRPVGPHHAVQTFSASAGGPELEMGKANAKAARDRAHRTAATHREDHIPTLQGREFFMARRDTPSRLACGAGVATDSLRSSSATPAPQANPPFTDQLLLALK